MVNQWCVVRRGLLLLIASAISFGLFVCPLGHAAELECGDMNSGSGWSMSSDYQCVGAIGRGLVPSDPQNSLYTVREGFISSFIFQPSADHNNDGIPDEDDPDDDGDGVSDLDEISGSLFDPVTPTDPLLSDTDGDGVEDIDEAYAGTNPQDSNAYLHLAELNLNGSQFRLHWEGREGFHYQVIAAETPEQLLLNPVVLQTLTAGAGSGLWKVSTEEYLDTNEDPLTVYSIRLLK